jgi:hypothetical protein
VVMVILAVGIFRTLRSIRAKAGVPAAAGDIGHV